LQGRKIAAAMMLSLFMTCAYVSAYAQLPNAPSATNDAKPQARKHGSIGSYLDAPDADAPFEPLSTGRKFRYAARNSFGLLKYPQTALVAGISQAADHQPTWGQGAEGYGKRYGAAFTDQAVNTMLAQGVFPAMFGQDPRYFRRAHGTFGQRLGYSISRFWFTRRDDGSRAANFSPMLAAAITAGVSRAYYPAVDRTGTETMRVWGVQVASDIGWNAFYEFWPDIRHAVFRH
jgi:hypothetical protein